MFQNDYDRYWKVKIMESPKAISYCKFKYNSSLEKYLYKIINGRHKIAFTRLRLSNHLRPKLARDERKCFICNDEIENELHLVVKSSLYASERKVLYEALTNDSSGDSNPHHSDVDLQISRNMFDALNHCAMAAKISLLPTRMNLKICYQFLI